MLSERQNWFFRVSGADHRFELPGSHTIQGLDMIMLSCLANLEDLKKPIEGKNSQTPETVTKYLHISISRGIKTQQLSQIFTPNCSPEWSHSSQWPKKNAYPNLILPLVDLPWLKHLKRWLWNTSPGYGLNTRSMWSNTENTDTRD